jgi:hypothetical protein
MKLLLILVLFSLSIYSQEYENNKIRIKFKSNSEILNNIENNKNDITLSEFLGNYTPKPYLSKELLFAYQKALEKKSNTHFLRTNNDLINIFEFEYSKNIDPKILARKISQLQDIEYAEPIYIRELCFTPNDPMLNDQYMHNIVKTFEAWELLDTTKTTVIAIVDTGIEMDHEDLAANIWYNSNEMGLDSEGRPKESNGIDDDGNGFIDDWRGWDFAHNDNNPTPGHTHGTHVAGIAAAHSNNNIGIAGISYNSKLVAIKIGADSRTSTSVINSYQGLFYAGIVGADIINCSWGGPGFSNAEQSIINAVNDLGSVIIAAAGNNGALQGFYPASYNGVLSVASTTNNDRQSNFSNYHPNVGVSAPGSNILSAELDNTYRNSSGTSMASPVVAGIAAMIKSNFTGYDNFQIIEHIKATTDNIESRLAASRRGNFGTGRVNALKALSETNPILVRVDSYSITDNDGNNIFEANDILTIQVTLVNKLNDVYELSYEANTTDKDGKSQIAASGDIGDFKSGTHKTITFDYKLPENLDYDFTYQIPLKLSNQNYQNTEIISFIVNQSYRNSVNPQISFTVNSSGNFGYNDYPNNENGIGVSFENQSSILFEGGIIVANREGQLASTVRSEQQAIQNSDFKIKNLIKEKEFENGKSFVSTFIDEGIFKKLGVEIEKTTYYLNENLLNKAIIATHKVRNISGADFDSLFLAYYFDWDIGVSGRNDLAFWDDNNQIMIQRNQSEPNKPKVGMAIISNHTSRGFAIDNDGSSTNNPGVYDGFTRKEQWDMMSGNLERTTSRQTDASSLISAGPISLNNSDTTEIIMIIMLSDDANEFPAIVEEAKKNIDNLKLLSVKSQNNNLNIYPNPTYTNNINYELYLSESGQLEVSIYDLKGNKISERALIGNHGYFYGVENTNNFSAGTYLLKVKDGNNEYSKKFVIAK